MRFNQKEQPYKLPFTIKLLDFDIEEFPPKLAYIENQSMNFPKDVVDNMILLKKGLKTQIADWNISVEDLIFRPGRTVQGIFSLRKIPSPTLLPGSEP